MKKSAIKLKNEEIVEYWSNIIDEGDIAVDWSDASIRCWRCARKRKTLERCHIVPESLGGSEDASNLILLCKECHQESPDVTESKFIWDWIKNTKSEFYDMWDTQKAFVEYKKVYNEEVNKSLWMAIPEKYRIGNIPVSLFYTALSPAFRLASTHFGVGYSVGTRVFILRRSIDLIREYFSEEKVRIDPKNSKDTASKLEKNFQSYLMKKLSNSISLKKSDFKGSWKESYSPHERESHLSLHPFSGESKALCKVVQS